MGAREWQDGLHDGGEDLIRRFHWRNSPADASAKCFDVGTLVWIVTRKIIKHLPGFGGAARASEDCRKTTDWFGVSRPQLAGKTISLFGFGSVIMGG